LLVSATGYIIGVVDRNRSQAAGWKLLVYSRPAETFVLCGQLRHYSVRKQAT